MGITIDELCSMFGVREITPAEYQPLPISDESYTDRFDGFALPPTRIIAPFVCDRLKGVASALEIGFGTGFRLLYYALNHPNTEFLAIDNDERRIAPLKKRIDIVKTKNVTLRLADMHTMKPSEFKRGAVIAMDCVPSDVPKGFNIPRRHYFAGLMLCYASMVNQNLPNCFLASVDYNSLTRERAMFHYSLLSKGGLSRVDCIPLTYQKKGDSEKPVTIIFAHRQ